MSKKSKLEQLKELEKSLVEMSDTELCLMIETVGVVESEVVDWAELEKAVLGPDYTGDLFDGSDEKILFEASNNLAFAA